MRNSKVGTRSSRPAESAELDNAADSAGDDRKSNRLRSKPRTNASLVTLALDAPSGSGTGLMRKKNPSAKTGKDARRWPRPSTSIVIGTGDKQKSITVYPCRVCDYLASQPEFARNHEARNHPLKRRCKVCKKYLHNQKELKEHTIAEHDVDTNAIKCDECDFIAADRQNLSVHLDSEHYKGRARNELCRELLGDGKQCTARYHRIMELRRHLAREHGIAAALDTIREEFNTWEEFMIWKAQFEQDSGAVYKIGYGRRNNMRRYMCVRSGRYKPSVPDEQRQRRHRENKTIKLGFNCTATMTCRFPSSGVISVLVYPFHYGHKPGDRRLPGMKPLDAPDDWIRPDTRKPKKRPILQKGKDWMSRTTIAILSSDPNNPGESADHPELPLTAFDPDPDPPPDPEPGDGGDGDGPSEGDPTPPGDAEEVEVGPSGDQEPPEAPVFPVLDAGLGAEEGSGASAPADVGVKATSEDGVTGRGKEEEVPAPRRAGLRERYRPGPKSRKRKVLIETLPDPREWQAEEEEEEEEEPLRKVKRDSLGRPLGSFGRPVPAPPGPDHGEKYRRLLRQRKTMELLRSQLAARAERLAAARAEAGAAPLPAADECLVGTPLEHAPPVGGRPPLTVLRAEPADLDTPDHVFPELELLTAPGDLHSATDALLDLKLEVLALRTRLVRRAAVEAALRADALERDARHAAEVRALREEVAELRAKRDCEVAALRDSLAEAFTPAQLAALEFPHAEVRWGRVDYDQAIALRWLCSQDAFDYVRGVLKVPLPAMNEVRELVARGALPDVAAAFLELVRTKEMEGSTVGEPVGEEVEVLGVEDPKEMEVVGEAVVLQPPHELPESTAHDHGFVGDGGTGGGGGGGAPQRRRSRVMRGVMNRRARFRPAEDDDDVAVTVHYGGRQSWTASYGEVAGQERCIALVSEDNPELAEDGRLTIVAAPGKEHS